MTTIADLEFRIRSAQTVIKNAEGTLERLNAELTELKEQEKDKEPESLFGRWATHPDYGRGIITSIKPDSNGEVRFAYRNSFYTYGVDALFVRVDDLTLDPATLTTAKEFKDAPNYTIAEDLDDSRYVAVIVGGIWYRAGDATAVTSEEMPPCRVIRWGNGQ